MTVYTQGGCQLTDLWIRMLHEVAIGLEPFICCMLYSFLQNLVIELVGELETILSKVIADILCHIEVDG